MGMAASQVRLLQLTARKNTIGRELEGLSMQKMSLTRAQRAVSLEYQNALNQTVYKWTSNGGATYQDLTYSTLMTPNSSNLAKTYFLTDLQNRVVIDSKYKKYAEMLSPDGSPGGDLDSVMPSIISDLCDIPEEKSQRYKELTDIIKQNKDGLAKLDKNRPEEPVKNMTVEDIGNIIGTAGNADFSDKAGSEIVDLGDSSTAYANLKAICDGIAEKMKNYLSDSDYEIFLKQCQGIYTDDFTETTFTGAKTQDSETLYKDGNNFKLNTSLLLKTILARYQTKGGSYNEEKDKYVIRERESEQWKTWYSENQKYETDKTDLETAITNAANERNALFNAAEESSVQFYEKLFSTIVENGWVYQPEVNNPDYLNQMLQNNLYLITSVNITENDEGKKEFDFSTDTAASCKFLCTVRDDSISEQALAEYEYQKTLINEKESKIDTRMENLKTEQQSITQMIQGIESVRNDNVERTFSIFT